jgi:hypothetical protein
MDHTVGRQSAMTEYTLTVRGSSIVSLKENDELILIVQPENNHMKTITFMDQVVKNDERVNTFSPTNGFWEAFVEMFWFQLDVAESIKYAQVDEEAIPHPRQWGMLRFPSLPAYENKILAELGYLMVEKSLETNTPFFEYPTLCRLAQTAHVEIGEPVPDFLRRSHPRNQE